MKHGILSASSIFVGIPETLIDLSSQIFLWVIGLDPFWLKGKLSHIYYIHIYLCKAECSNITSEFYCHEFEMTCYGGKATSELCRSSQLNANKMFLLYHIIRYSAYATNLKRTNFQNFQSCKVFISTIF